MFIGLTTVMAVIALVMAVLALGAAVHLIRRHTPGNPAATPPVPPGPEYWSTIVGVILLVVVVLPLLLEGVGSLLRNHGRDIVMLASQKATPRDVYNKFEQATKQLDTYRGEALQYRFLTDPDGGWTFSAPGDDLVDLDIPAAGGPPPVGTIRGDSVKLATDNHYTVERILRLVVSSRDGERITCVIVRFSGKDADGKPVEDKGLVLSQDYTPIYCQQWVEHLLDRVKAELQSHQTAGAAAGPGPGPAAGTHAFPRFQSRLPNANPVVN